MSAAPTEARGSWTKARVAKLTELWRRGLSASQIADMLGDDVTRNAVIGKITRIGLSGKARRTAPAKKIASSFVNASAINHNRAARKEALEQKPAPRHVDPAEPVSMRLTILELDPGMCRWPNGELVFTFCGHPAREDSSYCDFHHHVAYTGLPVPRRKAA